MLPEVEKPKAETVRSLFSTDVPSIYECGEVPVDSTLGVVEPL
jgi:hypothetical protein